MKTSTPSTMKALAFFDICQKLRNGNKKLPGIINTAGASALGKMVVKIGNRKGIQVISIVRSEEQVELLKNEGAAYVLNSNYIDFEEQLKSIAHQLNAKIIFDAVGGSMVQKLLDAAPKGCNLYIYGRLSGEQCEIDPGKLISTGNKIYGFWLTEWIHHKCFIQILQYTLKIRSSLNTDLSTHINTTFPPESVLEAIEMYKNNMSKGKVLLRF